MFLNSWFGGSCFLFLRQLSAIGGPKKKRVQDFSLFVIEEGWVQYQVGSLCFYYVCWIHPPHLVEDCSIFSGGLPMG